MNLIFGIENYLASDRGLYLALGNFDGVHLGHQRLIGAAAEQAKIHGGITGAFVFDPHPAQILSPDKAPDLLVSSASKAMLLEAAGVNTLVYHPFSHEIASWSPQEFVERILLEALHVKGVFVGFNYTFGYKGAGTPELLAQLGETYGFAVHVIEPVIIDGDLVSSSLIRQLLREGNISRARMMLGYYPFIEGPVVEGERRGRTLGFPTANIGVDAGHALPGNGVYAARARINDENEDYPCVVNIGTKPTFHEQYPVSIEAHIMNFKRDIYGKNLSLRFIDRIRDQKRFNSKDELVSQIEQDRDQALKIAERSIRADLN